MRKRLLSALLALCMALALLPAAFAADSPSIGYSDSGSTAMAKLTRREIAQLMELTELSNPTQIYVTEPGISAPYSAGSLRQDVLQAGLDRLNALRRIAGLPAVSLDASYSASTQAAALVNAVNNVLSHTPSRPSDMSDDLYRQGADGAGSSNIAYYYGYRPVDGPIAFSVDMWMDDSDAYNVDALGHRRWQLYPTLGKTGFGAVYTAGGSLFSAEYVFDSSGSSVDYDFIAWPSSGNFPAVNRLFHTGTAWSVTLNPGKYQTPSRSAVTVTLTRQSDGRSWTFIGSESYPEADYGKYINVENSGYGVSNCIIFRPDGVDRYEGIYTVAITGLQTRSGDAAVLSYQVDFFDPDDSSSLDTPPTEPEPSVAGFTDVFKGAYYADAVVWALENGVTTGLSDTVFGPDDICTRAQVVTFLWRAYGKPDPTAAESPFVDVNPGDYYYKAVLWALEKGITTGSTPTSFDPDGTCTRAQAVTFQWRAAGKPSVSGGSSFIDVIAGGWYADAVAWAVENRITSGVSLTVFAPDDPCTRGQVVTFLWRELGK